MCGEAGEAANFAKKLKRLDGADKHLDDPARRLAIAGALVEELADTVIYADLLASRLGLDLGRAVTEKFNLVSRQRGSNVFLPERYNGGGLSDRISEEEKVARSLDGTDDAAELAAYEREASPLDHSRRLEQVPLEPGEKIDIAPGCMGFRGEDD